MDFTEVLKRNPEVVTAYVNLGYVLNDLHQPQPAAAAFDAALKREPKNGEAHLGLAFSDLDLKKPQAALRHAQFAEAAMGDSEPIHVIRATAYGREGLLQKATTEYRAALRFSPKDGSLYLGLGNALFAERRYHDAIDQLLIAEKLSPGDPAVYAILARAYANLQDREQSLRYVQLAELHAEQTPAVSSYDNLVRSGIYVSTGQALSTLGDQNAAMERFRKALITPDGDRVSVRLAIAHLMAQQNREDDASRQIALGFDGGQAGETTPVTGDQYIEAADVFRGMHEYQLSQTYLQRAKAAGATDMCCARRLGQQLPCPGGYSQGAGRACRGQEISGQRIGLPVPVGGGQRISPGTSRRAGADRVCSGHGRLGRRSDRRAEPACSGRRRRAQGHSRG